VNLAYKARSNKLPDWEPAMSTITTTMFSATSRWDQLQTELQRLDQALSRRELEGLGDAAFRNIGITRCDSHRKLNKAFWMA
jgi:uncharacterized protein YjiS (DUF1127 family)